MPAFRRLSAVASGAVLVLALTGGGAAARATDPGGPLYPGAHQTSPASNPNKVCGNHVTQSTGYTVPAGLDTVLAWYRKAVPGKEDIFRMGGDFHLILSANGKLLIRIVKGHAANETMVQISSFAPPLPPGMKPTDDCLPL